MAKLDDKNLVLGVQVQQDLSGVGHCWKNVSAKDIPESIRLEIESVMIDERYETIPCYVASNGIQYRW